MEDTLTRQMTEAIGCVGVLVDAKPEAMAFYERLGFLTMESVAGQIGALSERLMPNLYDNPIG
jgi:hypothetical protein